MRPTDPTPASRDRAAIFPSGGRRPKRAAAGMVAAAAFAAAPGDEEPGPRSLLLITLDTTRRDAMGFHGRTPSPTPHLDALAAESVVFDDAYTVTPLTLPAHSSLLTGLYPLSHQLRDNGIAPLPAEATTLAEMLRGAGYRTGAAVACFVLDSCFGLDQGFESYDDVPRDPLKTKLFMAERPADRMVDRALKDLARMPGPFFYWLHLFDPHFPYAAPGTEARPASTPEEMRAEKRRGYLEEIRYLDRELGRLFDALRARPDWDDLAIVVTADHGESLGDGVEPTHGWFIYDPTVRVPLLVRFPGCAPRRSGVQASLIDLMPTALELLGVERGDLRFDGVSLAGVVRGESDELPERALALESWFAYTNFGWAPSEGCVQGALKYVRSRHERLFDRDADPGERDNRFAPDDPRARALRMRLDAALAAPAATLRPVGIRLDEAAQRALAELGYIHSSALDPAARPDFTALEDAEEHVEVIFLLERINTLFAQGRTDQAVQLLRELCREAPNAAFAHEQLAALLLTLRDPALLDEAETHLRIAIGIEPNRGKSHFDLGLVHMRRMGMQRGRETEGRHRREAIAAFRCALAVDRDSAQAMANLATMLRFEADALPGAETAERAALLRESIALFERYLTVVEPDHPDRVKIEAALAEYRARLESIEAPGAGGGR